MDFYNRLKNFFGLNKNETHSNFQERNNFPDFEPPDSNLPRRGFRIFTDPLEMHKYFEQQMNEMLKNFGFNFGHNESFFHGFNFPSIEDGIGGGMDNESNPTNLREQFLKPGYENAENMQKSEKLDTDLDGKLDIKDLDSIFHGNMRKPTIQFFGQSMSTKTIRKPDGSIEIHKTVRDNEGNEETKITRKIGDKEYSVTKRRNKDGKEEIVENLINLDDNELSKFLPSGFDENTNNEKIPSFFPFDKFFK